MGYRVKKIRLEKRMSQDELCKRAGVSRQTISDLESGREVNTTTATLGKIADALDCSIADILTNKV